MFARYGIPKIIVSDNGTAFISKEFKLFTDLNTIKHITSAVGHPTTNVQAENSVKTVKLAIKKNLRNVPL